MYKCIKEKGKTFLILLFGTIIMPIILYSQNAVNGLIINEVYLEETKPENNWIEIYNPSDKEMTLEQFRLSHIRTINVLPPDIRKEEGFI